MSYKTKIWKQFFCAGEDNTALDGIGFLLHKRHRSYILSLKKQNTILHQSNSGFHNKSHIRRGRFML